MTVTVSGKTFELRDRLKSLGGRWNGEAKSWEFYSLSDAHRRELMAHVGVVIGEKSGEIVPPYQPPPLRRTPSKFDQDALDELLADEPSSLRSLVSSIDLGDFGKNSQSINTGKTNVFGDDRTWLNYFRDQNPVGFWGFSSLSTMTKYLEALPHSKRNGVGWTDRDFSWTQTECMADAIEIARKGWSDGVELAEEIHESLTGRYAKQRRRTHTVAGGSVNVGRMLAGNPAHMIARPKRDGKKIVTFFVEGFISAGVDAENAIIRAALIGAIADVLEMNGYSCEIVSITTATGARVDGPAFQVATTLKAAGETLNLNDVVFGLGHPAFCRRFCFGCVGSDDDLRREWPAMGLPSRAFDAEHATRANELYIDKISLNHQTRIDKSASLIVKAMQIWDLIAKDRLPVELRREDAA